MFIEQERGKKSEQKLALNFSWILVGQFWRESVVACTSEPNPFFFFVAQAREQQTSTAQGMTAAVSIEKLFAEIQELHEEHNEVAQAVKLEQEGSKQVLQV